jgi:MarR family transcriptional regulator, transcriptional regulator for hemolysin
MKKELETTVLYVIDQTTKIAKQYSQKEFDLLGIGITVEQWILLKVVEEKSGLSQNELAKETNRDPASITRTLDLLQKKGLIIREAIADNRRQYNIMLSQEGIAFVKQNMPLINDMRNISIKGFSKEEVESLISMLYRIQKNME